MSTLGIALTGATGRMGRALLQAVHDDTDLSLAAALVRADSAELGQDAGPLAGLPRQGVALAADISGAEFDCLIDFSLVEPSLRAIDACVALGRPVVVGTTGFSSEQLARIDTAARQIPLLLAPNMSLGVNLMFRLVEMAARALGDAVDLEVIEAHHAGKVDAPSGTALRLGEALAAATGRTLSAHGRFERHGQIGARPREQIGFSTVRAGDIVGEHTVLLAGTGERLEITHRASSRMNFALGALRAAKWLVSQPPGRYDMGDVLGLPAVRG